MTTYRTAPDTAPGHCPRDGLPVADHPRCAVCTMLVGEGHYMERGIERDGQMLCEDCAMRREKKR